MWVGNVLNDTTVAELQAVFEAPPAEAEGDIPHDIPEVTCLFLKNMTINRIVRIDEIALSLSLSHRSPT